MMASKLILAAALAALLFPTTALGAEIYYKPGKWVPLPETQAGVVNAPGTLTIIENDAAPAQFALPMSPTWNRPGLSLQPVPADAWIAAELAATGRIASRDGILRALPPGSALSAIDLMRGVPDSFDLVIIYDFAESRLQPTESAALLEFIRRGGAVFFMFSSRAIPASSIEIWRDLFAAQGDAVKQEPALPRGFLVPQDFALRMDIPDMPRLAWKQSGRGVVLAYGLAPNERLLGDAVGTAELFERAVRHINATRRPISIGPVEPDAFRLFDEPRWSAGARRRLALIAGGYAIAAIGVIISFAGLIRKRGRIFVGSSAAIAALGVAAVLLMPTGSGLALDTVNVLIDDGTQPVLVTIGRIARLGPGRATPLMSMNPMPPRILLYGRYSATQRDWAAYRFERSGASVEPLLDIGQSVCLFAMTDVPGGYAAGLASAEPPPNAAQIISFFERRLSGGAKYDYRWCTPAPRLFAAESERTFTQTSTTPVLIATPAK